MLELDCVFVFRNFILYVNMNSIVNFPDVHDKQQPQVDQHSDLNLGRAKTNHNSHESELITEVNNRRRSKGRKICKLFSGLVLNCVFIGCGVCLLSFCHFCLAQDQYEMNFPEAKDA